MVKLLAVIVVLFIVRPASAQATSPPNNPAVAEASRLVDAGKIDEALKAPGQACCSLRNTDRASHEFQVAEKIQADAQPKLETIK